MYIAYMCELAHLHPIWVENRCTPDDVALTTQDWLEEVWRKVEYQHKFLVVLLVGLALLFIAMSYLDIACVKTYCWSTK